VVFFILLYVLFLLLYINDFEQNIGLSIHIVILVLFYL